MFNVSGFSLTAFPTPSSASHWDENLNADTPYLRARTWAYFSATRFLLDFPKEGRKGYLYVFKSLFWILYCIMETNQYEWLFIPLLMLWCASVSLTSTLNRSCLVSASCLRGGLPKAFRSPLGSCKTVTIDVCHLVPRVFFPTCGGSDCYGVPGPSFKLPGMSCFYVLSKS